MQKAYSSTSAWGGISVKAKKKALSERCSLRCYDSWQAVWLSGNDLPHHTHTHTHTATHTQKSFFDCQTLTQTFSHHWSLATVAFPPCPCLFIQANIFEFYLWFRLAEDDWKFDSVLISNRDAHFPVWLYKQDFLLFSEARGVSASLKLSVLNTFT